jgi:hypothetical protein
MRGRRLNLIRPVFTQLCIPKRYRMEVLEIYHNFGHVGFLKTYLTMKQVHFWPGMSFDVQHFVKTYYTCQHIKRDVNAPRPKLTSLPVRKMFEICHIDHHEIRAANASHGYRHVPISITYHGSISSSRCHTAGRFGKSIPYPQGPTVRTYHAAA